MPPGLTTPPPIEIRNGATVSTHGPAWLMGFLTHPPGWAAPTLFAAALLIIGLAALGYRRVGLSDEVCREIGENLVIVFGVVLATLVALNTLPAPYYVDVLAGWVGGVALAKLAWRWVLQQSQVTNQNETNKVEVR